jgi:nucleoside diphosphate kinase
LKSLIIIKPSALAKKAFGLIILKIEEQKLTIVAVKTLNFDIHSLERKSNEENDEEKKSKMKMAEKIPSVLVIVQGEEAINFGQMLKKNFKDDIHVSLNEETAKYEINRFFDKKEIFENDLGDANYFLTGKDHKEFLHKSIEEITKDVLGENKKEI